ncbi:MAG: flavin reductase family protein [Endomicrobium sp.]|jgi:ferric-chelate reductase [NAD(P)H]|nr:flavin reductase family protein [Endomicrobium sp.]
MDMKALTKIQYGIYVISSIDDEKMAAQLANSVFQITAEPVRFAVSIAKQNFTCEIIKKSGKFAITALSEETPFDFMGRMGFKSGRTTNKFVNATFTGSDTLKIPVFIDYATAIYEAEVENKIDVETHILFIGKIIDMKIMDSSQNTMTYDYYQKIKGGLTSKNAPTFIKK